MLREVPGLSPGPGTPGHILPCHNNRHQIHLTKPKKENTQNFQPAGRVYLFDDATRELLRELRSPNENFNSRFGSYAAGIEDVNGDGRGDIIVATGSGENRVYVMTAPRELEITGTPA